ncbi:MAG TPA: hypothetical protein VFJ45_09200, partial [bacterium]|nr:hypothetical protein [bacterium]
MRTQIALAALLAAVPALPAQDLFIQNARILDPVAKTETAGNILIRGGLIAGFPKRKPSNYSGP